MSRQYKKDKLFAAAANHIVTSIDCYIEKSATQIVSEKMVGLTTKGTTCSIEIEN
jgi:hypothetical protein